MRHLTKQSSLKTGKDGGMLIRKLTFNFLSNGKLTSTERRVKDLKSVIEKLMEKTKEKTEANKNYLLRHLGNSELIPLLFDKVGPVIKNKEGGYVRVTKSFPRDSDGARMAQLTWAYPITLHVKEAIKKDLSKSQVKKVVTEEKPAQTPKAKSVSKVAKK